jgi:NTP pyrophosphatase (non-canonical NTP hydrolase)
MRPNKSFMHELRAANVRRDEVWNPSSLLSLSFRGNELAGEIGEACNILKKIERERLGLVGSKATPEMLAEELADGVICLDLIAMEFAIDLEESIRRKFNKTSRERNLNITMMEW